MEPLYTIDAPYVSLCVFDAPTVFHSSFMNSETHNIGRFAQFSSNTSKAWVLGAVWHQGALLGGLGCVLRRACVIQWGQHGLLTLKAEPVRQLVDNAYLSWPWSALWAVFVLKARPSWVKLKRHKWKSLRGFTVRVLFNQPNKQTNKQASVLCQCLGFRLKKHQGGVIPKIMVWHHPSPKTNKQTNKTFLKWPLNMLLLYNLCLFTL